MAGLSEPSYALMVLAGLGAASMLLTHKDEEMDKSQRYYFIALIALAVASGLRLAGPSVLPFVEPFEAVFALFLGVSIYVQKTSTAEPDAPVSKEDE